jgi:choline dehydrogenase-like flavoprotein
MDSKTFDYVIIGGGTAGLVLASRLTEDPAVHVAVLEAGEKRLDVSSHFFNIHI